MKILIADDAPLIRDRLVGFVRNMPGVSSVVESATVETTLHAIEHERPDAIVLDLFMPGGSGLDVLDKIAGEEQRPRVIVMTAWASEEMRARCIEAGAEHFFEKGSDFLQVAEAVQTMVAEQTASVCEEPLIGEAVMPKGTDWTLEPGPTAHKPARGLRVLVVEDHDFQRRTLVRIVKSLGAADVLEAGDGVQALELVRRDPDAIQLILCDLEMPGMDGMECMRHLGETGSRASIIITSAHELSILNSVHTMCQAYGIRPLGIVEKPVDAERVRALIASIGNHQPAELGTVAIRSEQFSVEQIRAGIADGQFEPFFQPKLELATGKIVGVEALARWRHPELGVLPPGAFVDTLERSGNIDDLTFLMLERSAMACAQWQQSGLDLTVSVNLSLVSLTDTGLAERISRVVRDTGLDPKRMMLEITETAAMTQVAPALENLARLRMRGFGLSIDDYGTGFASMQQLGRVPFTELKIDRGFVSAMIEKREARAIVETSVDMARRLGIAAVAEGVETLAESKALQALGCRYAQGYYFSRPLDGQALVDFCMKGLK